MTRKRRRFAFSTSQHDGKELWFDHGDRYERLERIAATEHYTTLRHPAGHPQAGEPWRLRNATLDRMVSDGEIIAVTTTTRVYTQHQAAALDALPDALAAMFERHPRLPIHSPELKRVAELLNQYLAYDPQFATEAAK